MKNLKLISTILLSLMLIFTISTAVFADNEAEDNFWSDNVPVVDDNTVEDDNNTENDLFTELEEENIENEVENIEEVDTERNTTTTNSNALADTGIGDSNGIIALIVIVSGVVAIYSARKFNEYKNV